jgi:PPIC-type PPIASE domain/SurA N-terminal domain
MSVFTRFSVLAIAGSVAVCSLAQAPHSAVPSVESTHASTFKAPAVPVNAPVAPAANPDAVVARVNGVVISRAQYDSELKQLFPSYELHGNKVPKEFEGEIRRKALDNLINTELAFQEAKRRNLQLTPEEWQKRLSEIQKDYRSPGEFNAAILRMFGSRAAFEEKLRHDMLLDKLFLLEVKRKAAVSEVELQKYYAANKQQFVQPESISFQTISAMYPKNPTDADKKAARQRIEKLKSKAKAARSWKTFGLLAEKSSEDEFRVMMGERKMVHRQAIAPVFAFAFKMQPGQISDIVESTAGFHIVRLVKHQPTKHFTYAEIRTSIKEMLEKERSSARNKAFHEGLRKTAKVEILQG